MEAKESSLYEQNSCSSLSQNVVKVKVISLTSANQATGYGYSWSNALESAINQYKIQYGYPRKLPILID